ncbi:hypothetical protein, partial [Nonomuraea turkmeniaca]|uniref:hypothetical protein n=1 Tax=Nonomuraea turkmeniaca TaxID=103838 RepID=UPI001B880EBD
HVHRVFDVLDDDPGQVREKLFDTLRTRSTTEPFHVTRSATEPLYLYLTLHMAPYADRCDNEAIRDDGDAGMTHFGR